MGSWVGSRGRNLEASKRTEGPLIVLIPSVPLTSIQHLVAPPQQPVWGIVWGSLCGEHCVGGQSVGVTVDAHL